MVLGILLIGPLLAAVPSTACDPDLLDRDALLRASEGDYAGAARSWAAAYACEPRPNLLYSHGVALVASGDCATGVEVLRKYLALDVRDDNRDAADDVIAECGPPPPLPVVEPTQPSDPAVVGPGAGDDELERAPRPSSTRWWTDRPGGVLAGSGVVVAAVGAGFFGGAYQQAGRTDLNEDDYGQAEQRTRVFSAVGVGALATGGALIVGAVIRYAIVHRKRRRTRRGASTRVTAAAVPLQTP